MGISLSACLSATTVFLWLTESAQTAAESEGLWDPFHDGKHQQPFYQTISIIRPFTFDFNYRPVKFYDTVTKSVDLQINRPTQTSTKVFEIVPAVKGIYRTTSSLNDIQPHKVKSIPAMQVGLVTNLNKPLVLIWSLKITIFSPVTIISDETWVDHQGGAENTEK